MTAPARLALAVLGLLTTTTGVLAQIAPPTRPVSLGLLPLVVLLVLAGGMGHFRRAHWWSKHLAFQRPISQDHRSANRVGKRSRGASVPEE